MNYYLNFSFLVLLLLLIISRMQLNALKVVHLKVLWSIFEESLAHIKAPGERFNIRTPNRRFRIRVRQHGQKDELMPSFITVNFDVKTFNIADNVHSMDVEVNVNDAYNAMKVTFEGIKYQKDKIFILPFNANFALPIATMDYEESIFAKPLRHFHFSFSSADASIVPTLIECVEHEGKIFKTIWSHKFLDKRELNIREIVCLSDIYKFAYKQQGQKEKKIDIHCEAEEPIFELGFVNRFDILYNISSTVLTCHLNRGNNKLQPSGPVQFPICDFSEVKKATNRATFLAAYEAEATRRAPYQKKYNENLTEIMANYVKQKEVQREANVRANEAGVSANQQQVLLPNLGSGDGNAGSQNQNEIRNYGIGHHQHVLLDPAGSSGAQIPYTGMHAQAENHGEASGSAHRHIQTHQRGDEATHSSSIDDQLDSLLREMHEQPEQQQLQPVFFEEEAANHEAYKNKNNLKALENTLNLEDESAHLHTTYQEVHKHIDALVPPNDAIHQENNPGIWHIPPTPEHSTHLHFANENQQQIHSLHAAHGQHSPEHRAVHSPGKHLQQSTAEVSPRAGKRPMLEPHQPGFSPGATGVPGMGEVPEANLIAATEEEGHDEEWWPVVLPESPSFLFGLDDPLWSTPTTDVVDQHGPESAVVHQQHSGKGKEKVGEESSDATGIKRKSQDENVDSRLQKVHKEIAQTMQFINDQDEIIKKAMEKRAKACENLECLQKIAEELEQAKKDKEGGLK